MDFSGVEKKWQAIWEKAGIATAVPKKNKKKFFLIFAYPGTSGFLHVGHMRGFTYADVITRFKRMQGYTVLFPAGFHASGLPAVAYAAKVRKRDATTIEQLNAYGLSEFRINELEKPENVAAFFAKVYVEDFWKKFGFLIDYSRLISSIAPEYNRFIQWQFKKLHEKGLLIQKPHIAPTCPVDGPVAIDTAETDISKGGNAQILEYTIIKFRFNGWILPAATLRPETVFGVTNIWLNPDTNLVIAEYNNEKWLVAKEAAEKIAFQKPGFVVTTHSMSARELIGKKAMNPVNHQEIIILPVAFVEKGTGTGIVMSVPSHAPYDWVALRELQENTEPLKQYGISKEQIQSIKPISLIHTSNYGEHPAIEEVNKLEITGFSDPKKLEEATKNVYSAEFHSGKLNFLYGEFEGTKVSQAKEKLVEQFNKKNWADKMAGFSEPVVCRCGRDIVIKHVPDQWFIRYSDKPLTKNSIAHAQKMHILPEEYKQQMPAVLEWFSDRACVRQGSWLGTRFPFDEKWIIEPISDSTLYPLAYIFSPYVNNGKLKTSQLTDEFFDFVFLGKGNAETVARKKGPPAVLSKKIRADFLYWYPLDINLGGKEHKTVHFPVFLMNHVGILDQKQWPRGIFVHWWVVGETGKISKSKGGAVSLHDLAQRFSVDALRLYYCNIGNPHMDVTFSEETAQKYRNALERIDHLMHKALAIRKTPKKKTMQKTIAKKSPIDSWLQTKSLQQFRTAHHALTELKLKEFSEIVYYLFPLDLEWYFKRNGTNNPLFQAILRQWVFLLSPITPHAAEEWNSKKLGGKKLVSTSSWPLFSGKIDSKILQSETMLGQLLSDLENIKSLANIQHPKRITFFPAAAWKWNALSVVLESNPQKPDFKQSMAAFMKAPELRKHGNEAQAFIQKVLNDWGSLRELMPINEAAVLEQEKNFFGQKFGCEIRIEKNEAHEKTKKAFPNKPAILME